MTDYLPREIKRNLMEALKALPVVVLSGMRQTGKSTLLMKDSAFKKRRYVTLDDFNTLDTLKRNPEAFLEEMPITIDEAQKYPDLFPTIKKIVDKNRKPGQFLLSGSSNFLLLKTMSESLAGRALYLTLPPFTQREINGTLRQKPGLLHFLDSGHFPKQPPKPPARDEILRGGMPPVCLEKQGRYHDLWFKGYEQTYLEKDLRDLARISDISAFRNLLHLAAFRNGQVLKQSELARDAKLNVVTASRYISLLETSFIIYLLQPYLKNPASRILKSPKLYFSDSGLVSYLCGLKPDTVPDTLYGMLLETYIVQNIKAILSSHLPNSNLYYWNIQGRYEVDLIIEFGMETIGIEIKSSSRIRGDDLTGLKAFVETSKNCRAAILGYMGKEVIKLDEKLYAVPLSLLIS